MLTTSRRRRKRPGLPRMKCIGERAILDHVPRPRPFALVALAIACAALGANAFAQDVSVPMPNEYGAGSAGAADQIPDPIAVLNDDGSSFTIPIPGGGEIQVQGPQSESPQTIAPTENWATQRNTPFSVGGAPMGPVPPSR
jgi:hypothetical protein